MPATVGSMDPAERLRRFAQDRELSTSALAELLGCSRGFVSLLTTGRRRPGLTLAVAIETKTAEWADGPILAREWVSTEDLASPR